MKNATLVVCCIVCLLLGAYLGGSKGFNPLNPLLPAKHDRPVLKLLARLAKVGLWVAVFAEPQPVTPEQQYAHTRKHYSGNSLVCHQEGW